jgi:hypothetical protein
MKTKECKYLCKAELREANRQAIKAGCNSIEPDYIEKLPDDCRFPVFFKLPWERHGWVRCQVGTASDAHATDYMPLWLDVPAGIYENLGTVEVPVDEEDK